MADSKYDLIKRSISSWSLSTIKKPTFSAPKFRKPKLKIFSRIKTRTESSKVSTEERQKVNENLSLDNHGRNERNDNEINDADVTYDDATSIQNVENIVEEDETNRDVLVDSSLASTTVSSLITDDQLVPPHDVKTLSSVLENSDIQFIDDATIDETEDGSITSETSEKSRDVPSMLVPETIVDLHQTATDGDSDDVGTLTEESYSWWDAEGTLTRSNVGLKKKEEDSYVASDFYDADDSVTRTLTPGSMDRSYEDVVNSSKEVEDHNSEVLLSRETCKGTTISRCRSDFELNKEDKKWNKKNEIVLNTKSEKNSKNIFKFFHKRKFNKPDINDKRERLKKIFGIRKSSSAQSTIIDNNFLSNKRNDIYFASAPLALTSTVMSDTIDTSSVDSLILSEEETLFASANGEESMDEAEMLAKEINKYLNDTDLIKDTTDTVENDTTMSDDLQQLPSESTPENSDFVEVRQQSESIAQPGNPIISNDITPLQEVSAAAITENKKIEEINTKSNNQKSLIKTIHNIFSEESKDKAKDTLDKTILKLNNFSLKSKTKVSQLTIDEDINQEEEEDQIDGSLMFTNNSNEICIKNEDLKYLDNRKDEMICDFESKEQVDLVDKLFPTYSIVNKTSSLERNKELVEYPSLDIVTDLSVFEETDSDMKSSQDLNGIDTDESLSFQEIEIIPAKSYEDSFESLNTENELEDIKLPEIKLDLSILINNNLPEYDLQEPTFNDVKYPKVSESCHLNATEDEKENIPPKPVPRTKKNKYGYYKLSNEIRMQQDTNSKNAASHVTKEIGEPIYWEIPDSDNTRPKPSPRKKKEQLSISNRNSNDSSKSNLQERKSAEIRNDTDYTDLPQWITQRPPIPVPRRKKSTSNLHVNDASSHFANRVDNKLNGSLFSSSLKTLLFHDDHFSITMKGNEEGNFYSGKAASIAYGMTSHTKNVPIVPVRSKKSSMISLPGIVPAEELVLKRQKNDLHLQALKKQRRKTDSQEFCQFPSPGHPGHHYTTFPLQYLRHDLLHFTELLSSAVAVGESIERKTDVFLSDLVFSLQSLMGRYTKAGTWALANSGEQVSLNEAYSYLQDVFQVTSQKMDEINEKVKSRKAAEFSLNLRILEAKKLREKTVLGGSNPYVIVTIPNTDQRYQTAMEHETLCPKWNQKFTLPVSNLNSDIVNLQIWHNFDPQTSKHVSNLKNFGGLSRLVKEKTAIVHKQSGLLLGSVDLELKNISEYGLNEWYPIHKDTVKENKMRGFLHIAADVSATVNENLENKDRRRHYDALLTRIVYHTIKTQSNNNGEEDFSAVPWNGDICPSARSILGQHAMILGLNASLQNLSWWIACSKVPTVDSSLQLVLIQKVQSCLAANLFNFDDIESLAESLHGWTEYSLHKLRCLRITFPPSSEIMAKKQFSNSIRTFAFINANTELRELLARKGISDIKSQISTAVTEFVKIWWTNLIEEQLRGVSKPEEQIKRIITITTECLDLLNEISKFYGPALLQEFDISYFREIYLLLTNKLNPCVRPSVMNIYIQLGDSRQDLTDIVKCDSSVSYTLEDGSLLWKLYVNLGHITRLGESLPLHIREESGIFSYHRWFNAGVSRWVKVGRLRALTMIGKAVELDNFEPVDKYCTFSSSATDIIGIFNEVQIWWKNLDWPDLENSMALLAKILEDICSYSVTYSDLLIMKIESLLSIQVNANQPTLSKHICIALNNIERVRNELGNLNDRFGVDRLCDKIRLCSSLGNDISVRFQSSINTIIESAAEDLENKVTEFIDVVIEKMKGSLHRALNQACEDSCEKPLLEALLQPVQAIHGNMTDVNFKRFLSMLWEVLIGLFQSIVKRTSDKRKPSYFNSMYEILLRALDFFSPEDGIGLSIEERQTEEYIQLQKLLQCLRLSSENLIAKYYSDRHEDQVLFSKPTTELIMRAYFTRIGKLTVEVIMAKDLHLHHHESQSVSRTSHQYDPYIKVQLVPQEWFPNIHEVKTKTLRKCDPAVFEESFDFELKNDGNGVSEGFLLYTLKDYNFLGRTNTFLGEALIPLRDLPCVDSAEVSNVPNSYVKITSPNSNCGHSAVEALRLRSNDRVAVAFLKKIGFRLPSADEDKTYSKSPRLLQKLKFGT